MKESTTDTSSTVPDIDDSMLDCDILAAIPRCCCPARFTARLMPRTSTWTALQSLCVRSSSVHAAACCAGVHSLKFACRRRLRVPCGICLHVRFVARRLQSFTDKFRFSKWRAFRNKHQSTTQARATTNAQSKAEARTRNAASRMIKRSTRHAKSKRKSQGT